MLAVSCCWHRPSLCECCHAAGNGTKAADLLSQHAARLTRHARDYRYWPVRSYSYGRVEALRSSQSDLAAAAAPAAGARPEAPQAGHRRALLQAQASVLAYAGLPDSHGHHDPVSPFRG